MDDTYSYIVFSCANLNDAKKLINILFRKKLVACVQEYSSKSFYVWRSKFCTEKEIICKALCKTKSFDEISRLILENTSFQNPEILQVPIINGSTRYMNWIDEVCE